MLLKNKQTYFKFLQFKILTLDRCEFEHIIIFSNFKQFDI